METELLYQGELLKLSSPIPWVLRSDSQQRSDSLRDLVSLDPKEAGRSRLWLIWTVTPGSKVRGEAE